MVSRAAGIVIDSLTLNAEPDSLVKLDAEVKGESMFDVAQLKANESAEASTTSITAITHDDGVATVTSATHGLAVNDLIKIANVTGATEANGYWKVTSVPDASTFTFALTSMTAYVS